MRQEIDDTVAKLWFLVRMYNYSRMLCYTWIILSQVITIVTTKVWHTSLWCVTSTASLQSRTYAIDIYKYIWHAYVEYVPLNACICSHVVLCILGVPLTTFWMLIYAYGYGYVLFCDVIGVPFPTIWIVQKIKKKANAILGVLCWLFCLFSEHNRRTKDSLV